jgi:hypothetical protein
MMTPTPEQYTVAADAILKVIQGDVAALPGWEQGMVPAAMEAPLAGAAAKAALDAVFAQMPDAPISDTAA